MLCKTNAGGGGGGSSAWAYIGVTYPEGSSCTATNGSITLSAQGTSGLYVFGIPEPISTPETWTVTCTNGVKTKSAEAELSQQYSFAVISLRYSRLPEGYQEVEYLESSGTQYYNLGLFADLMNTEITLDFMVLAYKSSTSVMGNIANSSSVVHIGLCGNSSNSSLSYAYSSQVTGSAKINERTVAVLNNDSNQITENGTAIGSKNMSYNLSTRLYLFGIYTGSTPSLINSRVYSFAMRNKTNNTYILNYVPCYRESDDVAGFYDLANNAFVTGTGTFTVGADV